MELLLFERNECYSNLKALDERLHQIIKETIYNFIILFGEDDESDSDSHSDSGSNIIPSELAKPIHDDMIAFYKKIKVEANLFEAGGSFIDTNENTLKLAKALDEVGKSL